MRSSNCARAVRRAAFRHECEPAPEHGGRCGPSSARARPKRASAASENARAAWSTGSRAPVIRQARSCAAFRAHGLGAGRARGASPPPRHPAARSARRPPRGAWSARSPPARQVRERPRSCGDEGAGLTQTTRARDPARRRTHPKSARARRHALRVRRSARTQVNRSRALVDGFTQTRSSPGSGSHGGHKEPSCARPRRELRDCAANSICSRQQQFRSEKENGWQPGLPGLAEKWRESG